MQSGKHPCRVLVPESVVSVCNSGQLWVQLQSRRPATFFDSDGWYNGCLAGRAADEGTAAKPYSEVITTYVKH